jgi:serine phosphatase RsbU (regulator of sigma subunit)
MDGDPLTPDGLAPIIGPFAASGSPLAIRVESPDGLVIAAAGSTDGGHDGADDHEARHDIRSSPSGQVVGRVVGRGEGPLVDAVVSSVASALGALVGASHVHQPADAATHRIEAELALGRRIQRSFVPLSAPTIPGYDIASHYEAAREVGGDFFDVFRMRTRVGRLAVVIADVTGKGIAAALLMAFARPLIRAAIDHVREPAAALNRTNRILVDERRSALFVTALCATVELRSGFVRIANAGHEPPLLVPADGSPIRWMPVAGSLLGAFSSLDLADCSITLEPGDLLLLYTDGVTDARAASGERFGDGRLIDIAESTRGGSAREVVEAVCSAYHTFQGEMPAADDVTIVAVRREPVRGRRGAGGAVG